MVVWFINEQFSWGKKLQEQGVACDPLRSYDATPKKLAWRIRQVLDNTSMKHKAEELSESMRVEDGIGEAIRLIEELDGRT